jgi:uracil-DNA glycosylase family 4
MLSKPTGCSACPLVHIGQGFVPCQLPPSYLDIKLLIQGEAPGQNEADEGLAFIGKVGHWIRNNILYNAGVRETQVIFDNTLRCLPPMNKKGEHYPIGDARATAEQVCRQYDVWDAVPVAIPLLLVGGKALQQRLGFESISNYHGHITTVGGRIVGATYHPSAVMRNPNLLPVAIRETSNVLEAAANPAVLARPEVKKQFTPYYEGQQCVVDLEWNGAGDISVVGVAYDSKKAYSSFGVDNGLEVVRQHLASGTRIVGHNFITADLPRIDRTPQSFRPEHICDTMIMGHLVHAHLAELGLLGLGDLVRFYAPTTDWKQEKTDLLQYNGYDCAYNFRLFEQLSRDLDATEQWHLVEKQQRLAWLSHQMHERGIRVDADAIRSAHLEWRDHRDEIKAAFPFNPNSHKQVKEHFYKFGISLSDTSYDTIDKAARNLGDQYPELLQLLKYKDEGKSLKVWFPIQTDDNGDIVDIAEWMHPYFHVTGTAVARFSSSGPNCQNIPPYLRHIIIPREPGLEIVSFDAKNIENRTVAYIAGDFESLEKWAEGYDPYTLTAVLMYRKSYDEIKEDQKKWAALKQKKESLREKAKTTELASIYGETHYNLARRMYGNTKKESLARSKADQTAFFNGRPRIKAWHRKGEEASKLAR